MMREGEGRRRVWLSQTTRTRPTTQTNIKYEGRGGQEEGLAIIDNIMAGILAIIDNIET